MLQPDRPRIGYVLKMYPRLSETFIVSEILAREADGAQIEIFSLRAPRDSRFHETLGAVRAPVTWISHAGRRAADLWELLGRASAELPSLAGSLGDLLAANASDGAQALELALAAREHGIDHLHAHFGSAATTVARLAGRIAEIPYSFTVHAKDLFHEDVVAAELERKLAEAHHVVTISDYNRRFLSERYGSAADGVRLIRNGLMLDAFPFVVPDDRPPAIVAVGRLVEKKGFDVLLDACARLAGDGRRFRCDLVGDGPLAGDLRAQAARLGLLGDVVRFHGSLSQRGVRATVTEAAVLAAPCVVAADGNRDGLPTVLLEAMALGTPCVTTPVTGIPEAVRDGETGLLVPERDADALAAALARLLDDVDLRVRLARAGRALVEREHDAQRQARALDALVSGAPETVRTDRPGRDAALGRSLLAGVG